MLGSSSWCEARALVARSMRNSVPTGPVPETITHLTSWSSHIAWAVQRPHIGRSHLAWDLFLSPCFLGGDPLDIPPAHTTNEAAARAWLTVISESWLRLVDANL
jgi:hypothetical protein